MNIEPNQIKEIDTNRDLIKLNVYNTKRISYLKERHRKKSKQPIINKTDNLLNKKRYSCKLYDDTSEVAQLNKLIRILNKPIILKNDLKSILILMINLSSPENNISEFEKNEYLQLYDLTFQNGEDNKAFNSYDIIDDRELLQTHVSTLNFYLTLQKMLVSYLFTQMESCFKNESNNINSKLKLLFQTANFRKVFLPQVVSTQGHKQDDNSNSVNIHDNVNRVDNKDIDLLSFLSISKQS